MCCGTNAHHQNRIAEKRILDLQEKTQSMLLYATNEWSKMLSIALWPYVLCMSNEIHDATPLKDGEHSPMELFTQVNVSPKIHQFHMFGSLICMLDSKLQSRTSISIFKHN